MIIDGTATANAIHQELAESVQVLKPAVPKLVAILVGDNPASHIYVNAKVRACLKVGIASEKILLPATTQEPELSAVIDKLNASPEVTGILMQLPLPGHLDSLRMASRIAPEKDVDGATPVSHGKLLMGDPTAFIPCTPLGIQVLLMRHRIEIKGRHVVIAGRSNIVGKPLACLLMQKAPGGNATVTVVHSQTPDIARYSRQADILVAAIGQPEFFKANMVRDGAVVIDVGQNRIVDASAPKGARLVGDVAYEEVKAKSSWITPVPGGVGPMTIAMLLSNTLKAFHQSQR